MTDAVRKTSDIVDTMAEDWTLIDAVMGGTKAMRRAGKAYLPQWPAEDAASYRERLRTATFFPAYSRTVSVLTSKPFSKPVKVGEDVPGRIADLFEDIDMEGRNLHAFAADVCMEALSHGLCGILVDCPPNQNAKTLADERKAGVRPYFVHIRHNQILGWKTEKASGGLRLSSSGCLKPLRFPMVTSPLKPLNRFGYLSWVNGLSTARPRMRPDRISGQLPKPARPPFRLSHSFRFTDSAKNS